MADPFQYDPGNISNQETITHWLLLLIARAVVETLPAGATKNTALAALSKISGRVLPGG